MRSQSTEQEKSWHSQTHIICDRCCVLVNSFFQRAIVTTCPMWQLAPVYPIMWNKLFLIFLFRNNFFPNFFQIFFPTFLSQSLFSKFFVPFFPKLLSQLFFLKFLFHNFFSDIFVPIFVFLKFLFKNFSFKIFFQNFISNISFPRRPRSFFIIK